MSKRVSMKDIAQKLGVSTALVSYVLNNQLMDRINKDTAEKIRALAEEMGYHPNQIAKSLKERKTQTIGVIVSDISNPFSAHLARIIEDEAKQHGYTVIFGSADESHLKSRDLIHALMSRQVDGFIIAAPEGAEEQLRLLIKQDMPVVLIDRYFPGLEMSSVTINNFDIAYEGVCALLCNGFKKIGMLNLKSELFNVHDRSLGYLKALADAGYPMQTADLMFIDEKNVWQEVIIAIDKLLNQDEPVDALFFGSNVLAIAGLSHIRKLNIQVPETLGIVCFDDSSAYNLFYCPLSYIDQPLLKIGQSAVELLLDLMKTGDLTVKRVVLNAELVINKSAVRNQ